MSNFALERVFGEEIGKKLNLTVKLFVAFTTIFYVVSIALIQVKGLNTTGLEEVCDINPSLLSSKTGYLLEWFQQN